MKHFKLLKGVLACLLSLALALTCIGTVGIKADTPAADTSTTVEAPNPVSATYKWATNTIESSANQTAYVYVLKTEKGNTIKAGTAANGQMAQGKVSLADLKVTKINKDAYFYVCDKEFETEGKSINANLVIKATTVKKAAGKIDYTQADNDESLKVLSATATDNSKKEIKDPVVYWSTEANGTYYPVGSDSTTANRKYANGTDAAPDGFDGKTLKEMLPSGGVIYIKIAGEDGESGKAQFASKVIKVKIAKQAAAPKAKIDVKKDTIALKNGFDFGLAEKVTDGTTETYVVSHWFTILPNLKGAAVKDSKESIVPTNQFTPLGKKDSNAGKKVAGEGDGPTYSYTAYKFKTLSIDTMLDVLEALDEDCLIAIRKSATEKKPASAYAILDLKKQAGDPLVYTQDNVAGEYLVATCTDFEKKGMTISTIVPNPGSLSGESVSGVATEGYSDSFKVITKATSGEIVDADNGGSSFEFAIIKQADIIAEGDKAIDWSTVGWKKFEVGKTKITSKLKTSYKTIGGSKVKAELKAESSKPANADGAATILVIRRTGDKSGVRASEYIRLYVVKEGKNYNLYSETDNGEVASKYTIKFLKYMKNATGNDYSWQEASDVEDITLWIQENEQKYVKLPEIAGATLYKTEAGSGATTAVIGSGSGEKATSSTSGYSISGAATDTVEYIAVREYANITVKQEISISGSTTKDTIVYYQQKDGKYTYADGTSGEATFYVGDNFTLSVSGLPTCKSSSGATVAAGSGEGVTFSGSDATVTSKAINTAEEVVIVIPYVATPNYKVTYESTKATTVGENSVSCTVAVTKGSGSDAVTSNVTLIPLGSKITVTVTAASGYKITSVKINGTAATITEGVASAEITVSANTTITLTDLVAVQTGG